MDKHMEIYVKIKDFITRNADNESLATALTFGLAIIILSEAERKNMTVMELYEYYARMLMELLSCPPLVGLN
jgi:hypothetical protein